MTKRHSQEFIEAEFSKRGYKVLGVYKSNHTPLRVICGQGHVSDMRYAHFKRGHTCLECWHIKMRGNGNHKWKGGVTGRNKTAYDSYADKIDYAENIRRDPEDKNILQVTCTYCGKWYSPNMSDISSRIGALEGRKHGENRLYCSDSCKKECPVFSKKTLSAEQSRTKKYSREVQPELRQIVFKRDGWECIKCGSTESLHCHHVEGVRWNPIESADADQCVTLCKKCHKKVHKKKDCGYNDMKCDK